MNVHGELLVGRHERLAEVRNRRSSLPPDQPRKKLILKIRDRVGAEANLSREILLFGPAPETRV
jgi:hypothetical protein